MEGPGGIAPDEEIPLRRGIVAPAVAEEFPELVLLWTVVERGSGRTPRSVRDRLDTLSNRFYGGHAITMRQSQIPWAYRVFFRQVGIDPDAQRTPVEAAALERLLRGRYESQNLLDDALTIALVETGVPIWALDADQVELPLAVRGAGAAERLGRGEEAPALPPGRLVLADAVGPVAVLFGDVAPPHGVSARTKRMTLFSLQVAGVPGLHVEEAFWTCLGVLEAG